MRQLELTDEHRLAVANAVLKLINIGREAIGNDPDHLSIMLAVAISAYEGHPIGIQELVELTDIPRATLIRKIAVMNSQGHIYCKTEKGKVYVYRTSKVGKNREVFHTKASRVIRVTAKKLSRLDNWDMSHIGDL